MHKSRNSRCVIGHEFNGRVECGVPVTTIVDGAFVPVNPLDSKKDYDPAMFLLENLADSGIELKEMTLESNDVLGASNLANSTIDVVNFIGINKTVKKSVNIEEKVIVNNSNNVEPSPAEENK